MKNDTGETTASINRRLDDQEWAGVKAALETGATLFRPARLDRYYIDRDGRVGGGSLTSSRVKKLERAGMLIHVGVDRYGLRAGVEK